MAGVDVGVPVGRAKDKTIRRAAVERRTVGSCFARGDVGRRDFGGAGGCAGDASMLATEKAEFSVRRVEAAGIVGFVW